MARLTYGAKVLIAQVQERRSKASAEAAGEPDGLGVHRTIRFDKRTSKWLAPLLEAIEDPRVTDLHTTDAGYLHVTFTHKRDADRRDLFPLDDAAVVAGDE